MEYSHLGKHCQYDLCRQRDFLPFDCSKCAKSFCLSHRTREGHECASLALEEAERRTAPPPPSPALPAKFRCHAPHCRTREIFSLACRNCGHNHCLKHRFPTQHACEAVGKSGRNTILPVGAVAAKPVEMVGAMAATTSGKAKPAAAAAASSSIMPTPSAAAAAVAASVATAPFAANVAALSISGDQTEAGAVATASASPPLPVLLRSNTGSSCAAEMAQAGSAGSQSSTTAASSASSTSAATSVSVAATSSSTAVTRRANTNVAHLSRLLKQHS
jgi:predicted nucleic acid binding AN1-type Zn finger protein